ncbi:hypothetical protein ACFVMC_27375 [Nocardia sp. NPDC127579]|uniref:hypothetical protein n=1 Tax=Nocardia sp. NPDC127579 TaxID=3345402 RepID=UPI0036252A30
MTTPCPTCAWPTPTLVSTHGTTHYLRCVCGQWLIREHRTLVAAPGPSDFPRADRHTAA